MYIPSGPGGGTAAGAGIGSQIGIGVGAGVGAGVGLGAGDGVGVGVGAGVAVGAGVWLGDGVGVGVAVDTGVDVGSTVGVRTTIAAGARIAVGAGAGITVGSGAAVGTDVANAGGEGLGSDVGEKVGSGWAQANVVRVSRLRRPTNLLIGIPHRGRGQPVTLRAYYVGVGWLSTRLGWIVGPHYDSAAFATQVAGSAFPPPVQDIDTVEARLTYMFSGAVLSATSTGTLRECHTRPDT